MKPYLVDVPVKLNIWIRPECQRKQFEVIKQARPSILFLVSDGGRNEKEWEAIYQNRRLYDEEIDWECTVYKLYEDKNNGMYTVGKKSRELVWSNVDRCIFLEDDVIPSVSFFRYCAELLEKYKDDYRVHIINGMNHLGVYEDVNTDYFFSRVGSIWGFATWKRVFEGFDDFSYYKDEYVLKRLMNNSGKDTVLKECMTAYPQNILEGGHSPGGEFWFTFDVFAQNQLNIVPKKNMISNIGCTEDAAHAAELKKMSKGAQQIFNMRTHELEFPLKHARYVIPDFSYEKRQKRIMGWHHPLVQVYRKCECFVRALYYDDFKANLKKVKRRIIREKKIET